MKKTFLFGMCILLALASCQDYYVEPEGTNVLPQPTSSIYNIPIDSALSYLYAFMADEELSRESEGRVVASIKPIKYNLLASRSDQDSINCENLLYIANFEQEKGYAILAADDRISDKVIAVIDEGSLSEESLYNSILLSQLDKITIKGYPADGEGFFTTPETGDELFMNPNTASLYIEEENDTLVGNIIDEIEVENNNGAQMSLPYTTVNISEFFTNSMCVSYAINEIKQFNKAHNYTGVDGDAIGGGGAVQPSTRQEFYYSNWEIISHVDPLLVDYKDWNQTYPFNKLYPDKSHWLFFWKKRKAPAGCFPLAIAKIFAYFENPGTFMYNGKTVNWSALQTTFDVFNTIDGQESAGLLLKGISVGCGSWYFYEGTFTFPTRATSYMRGVGYGAAHSHGYSFNKVTNMIDNGKPAIVYAMPNIDITSSHSWNIDGYKIQERTITILTYRGDALVSTAMVNQVQKMVHCDFGWGGTCNGYYVSGVFNLRDSRVEHDPGTSFGNKGNYNTCVRIVTY